MSDFTVGLGQEKTLLVKSYKGDSQCRIKVEVGNRVEKGVEVKMTVHYKMGGNTHYFGFAIGYEVGYVQQGGSFSDDYKTLVDVVPAGYKTSNGKVVSGYGLGDPKGLIKRYGGGMSPGSYYGDHGTYWRPKYGWLPESSGPRKGTSVVFDGVVPMKPSQSKVNLYYRTRRPKRTTDQTSIEEEIKRGTESQSQAWFNVVVQKIIIDGKPAEVVPSPPKTCSVTPTSIPLEKANSTKVRLRFDRGKAAQKTRVYAHTDMPFQKSKVLVETSSAATYDKEISVWGLFGTADSDGKKHIPKEMEYVGGHVWFTLDSVSSTDTVSKTSCTSQKVVYTETKTIPPRAFTVTPSRYFFDGDEVAVQYIGARQGTFEIESLELVCQSPDTSYDAEGPFSSSGSFDVELESAENVGWDASTGLRPTVLEMYAYDELGDELYDKLGMSRPKTTLYGYGGVVYEKEGDSWDMGIVYVMDDGKWLPASQIEQLQNGVWS